MSNREALELRAKQLQKFLDDEENYCGQSDGEMIIETAAVKACIREIRQALTRPEVDVEGLKNYEQLTQEDIKNLGGDTHWQGWKDAINYLQSQGYLSAPDTTKDAAIGYDLGAPDGDLSCLMIGLKKDNGGLDIQHCVYGEEAEALYRALNQVPALRQFLRPDMRKDDVCLSNNRKYKKQTDLCVESYRQKDDAIRDLARSLIEIKEFANTVDTESYGDGLYLSIAQQALTKHAEIIEGVE